MQLNTNIQFCTTSADLVRNIFPKQPFSTKSSDLNCLLLIGHASRPYNSTGRHLIFNSSTVTSSEATPATVRTLKHLTGLQWKCDTGPCYVRNSSLCTVDWNVWIIMSVLKTFIPHDLLPQTTEEIYVSVRTPEFVCLCARLLKNACMDLDEMLRVDRCRDIEELINFWARSGSQSGYRNRIPFSHSVCTATVEFYYVGKIPWMYWYWGKVQARGFEASKTPLSEVNALYRVHFQL